MSAPFTILYRWRLKKGKEEQFAEAWTAVTEHYRRTAGSLGSRLHRGSDGIWYAYAQWPSDDARQKAFLEPGMETFALAMNEAVDERLQEVYLDIVSDRLG